MTDSLRGDVEDAHDQPQSITSNKSKVTQSAHDLYPRKNTEASAGSAECQDLPNPPDQNSFDNKENNQLSSESDKTVAYQTSLVKAISSVIGKIESLKKLDRMRVAWKKDQQNKSKEQGFKNELARTTDIIHYLSVH